jgi:uncharacterized protein (DUF697 family)
MDLTASKGWVQVMVAVAEKKTATKSVDADPALDVSVAPPETVLVAESDVDQIVRRHVYGAMALGLVPVPIIDVVGLTALQLNLVNSLSKAYGVNFQANLVKPIIGSLVGGVLPVAVTPIFASLIKAIPVIGYTAGAASLSLLGGAATYAIGRVFSKHFASGGTIHTFDAEAAKAAFKEEFESGKKVAGSLSATDGGTAAAA